MTCLSSFLVSLLSIYITISKWSIIELWKISSIELVTLLVLVMITAFSTTSLVKHFLSNITFFHFIIFIGLETINDFLTFCVRIYCNNSKVCYSSNLSNNFTLRYFGVKFIYFFVVLNRDLYFNIDVQWVIVSLTLDHIISFTNYHKFPVILVTFFFDLWRTILLNREVVICLFSLPLSLDNSDIHYFIFDLYNIHFKFFDFINKCSITKVDYIDHFNLVNLDLLSDN